MKRHKYTKEIALLKIASRLNTMHLLLGCFLNEIPYSVHRSVIIKRILR